MRAESPEETPRLGLALSGGGFRATFFHLGVLKRLAELDVLRHVDVISTVSGGSILGAHYMLHLRREHDSAARAQPRRAVDYVGIVRRMEDDLRGGVRANLRSRLFVNPIENLRMIVLGDSLGGLMARFYDRHIFTRTPAGGGGGDTPRRDVLLKDMRFPLDGGKTDSGIRRFNRSAPEKVPTLILNAASLNSGRPFRMTFVEIGDPLLGYLREDETGLVRWYRDVLRRSDGGAVRDPSGGQDLTSDVDRERVASRLPAHLAWWRLAETLAVENGGVERAFAPAVERYHRAVAALDPASRVLTDLLVVTIEARGHTMPPWETTRRLATAEFGVLRRAKIAAWYLRNTNWDTVDRRGGYTREEHRSRFWDALEDIDTVVVAALENRFKAAGEELILDFILDLYYLRSARAFSPDAQRVFDRLTLAAAVAMSANFPPVFAPYRVRGLYDPSVATVLALTDGGVHDNQGIDALVAEGCTHMIASDAGGILPEQKAPSQDRLVMMGRIGSAFTARLRDLQLAGLRELRRVTRGVAKFGGDAGDEDVADLRSRYTLQGLAFFHMASSPHDAAPLEGSAPPPHPAVDHVARLRTDLDVFSAIEVDALVHQGYQLADRFVRTDDYIARRTGFVKFAPPASSALPGSPRALDWETRILKAGRKRFGRLMAIYPALGWVAAVLGVAAVSAVWLWTRKSGPLAAAESGVAGRLPEGLTRVGRDWSELVAVLAVAFVVWRWSPFSLWRRNLWWMIGLALAIMWGGGWWIVGTGPLWLSLLGMLFSIVLLVTGRITDRVASRRVR